MYSTSQFYVEEYFGNEIPLDDINKYLSRASDELDTLTYGRLIKAYPTEQIYDEKVQKAVCAVAECLYKIEEQRKAVASRIDTDGKYTGPISSIKAGEESVSYASVNSSSSVYSAAAASKEAQNQLIAETAVRYIANVPDANGINLLYAGGEAYV